MPRVLIVDDAATVRMYHRELLEGADFVIEEAANGYEALERALQTAYDLFLVDVNMPKMDGYHLTRELRREPGTRATPIIMISTEAEESDVRAAYEAGASLYLKKPVQAAHLRLNVQMLTGVPLP